MTKPYRLKDKYSLKPVIQFRYGDDGIDYSVRLVEPLDDGTRFLRTEQDVIRAWADFAKDALLGEFRESDQQCWNGHYEQFGMVMLTLARLSRYRKDFRNQWNSFLESTICKDIYEHIYGGPSGTECKVFYRCWFALIGHQDFLANGILRPEAIRYKDTELSLCIAMNDFDLRLHSLKR